MIADMKMYSEHILGDMLVQYIVDESTRNMSMCILPCSTRNMIKQKEYKIDSLIQLKILGDDYAGVHAQGLSLRNSQSTQNLVFKQQEIDKNEHSINIKTILENNKKHIVEHLITWYTDTEVLKVTCSYTNTGGCPVKLEMISSYSITGISPYEADDAPGILKLHRIRSYWSAEGRVDTNNIENLGLERSWQGNSPRNLRFGQIGSMPTNIYFPFAIIEDTKRGVMWGSQLINPASWQMEIYRRDDAICMSGGIADREFGQWVKEVKPAETFYTPSALLSTCVGDIDTITQRLVSFHKSNLEFIPEVEQDLPIIFNEFCTSWGNPNQHDITEMVHILKGRGIKYFVIDCGWYTPIKAKWFDSMGDWKEALHKFPHGIKQTASIIRNSGMIPGIWFEFENCAVNSSVFHEKENFLLKRDGYVITAGRRRFFDMRKQEVHKYLDKSVLNILKEGNFGYLKIDYNETIGIGCDGAESPGEGLRQNMQGTIKYIKHIIQEIPDLVIENCSSGGHRLEPSFMSITSMSSFSDAHECVEIPIIAANLHRVLLPAQSQIWAVLRKQDTERRLIYTLGSTFLGRMCLSGDILDMNKHQWRIIDKSISFYNKVTCIIKYGRSRILGPKILTYRHPEGWQAVVRQKTDNSKVLLLIHTFGGKIPETINIPLPAGKYCINDTFTVEGVAYTLCRDMFSYSPTGDFECAAFLLDCL